MITLDGEIDDVYVTDFGWWFSILSRYLIFILCIWFNISILCLSEFKHQLQNPVVLVVVERNSSYSIKVIV